jgi:hypothetical protein
VWTRSPHVLLGLSTALAALVLLPACGTATHSSATSSGAPQATTPATTVPITTVPINTVPPSTRVAATRKWTDLQVGDCLAELPPVDLSAQTVTVVDCATPHAAEVYLRAPVEVNAAIADVANKKCIAGFKEYTGQPIGGPYAMTYLIDSDQNRTSSNPDPSTVICLLEAAGSGPLTSSTRS